MDDALEQLEQALEITIDRDVMKGLAVNLGLPLLAATQLRRGDLGAARAAAERGIELALVCLADDCMVRSRPRTLAPRARESA